jgi:hypothetical protein
MFEHLLPRRFYTQALEETSMTISSFSRHNQKSRRTQAVSPQVNSLEGRCLLSGMPPMLIANATSAQVNGVVGVHVAGMAEAQPGAMISPVLGFEIVSSTGRVVETGEAPLAVNSTNSSVGSFDFWLALTPSQLSNAGGQRYTIDIVASDMSGDMNFTPALIPTFPPPPGVPGPLDDVAPTDSSPTTPFKPAGYIDFAHGVVYN